MSTARPLTPDEKKQLASLRALIGSEQLADVQQGVALLLGLQGTALFELFAEGVSVSDSDGTLFPSGEIGARARAAFRSYVALSVLLVSPSAAAVKRLTVDVAAAVDLRALSALEECTFTAHDASPIHIDGLKALARLNLRTRGPVTLGDLPVLQTLSVKGYDSHRAAAVTVGDLPDLRTLAIQGGPVTLGVMPMLQTLTIEGPAPQVWNGPRSPDAVVTLRGAPVLSTLEVVCLARVELPALPALQLAGVRGCEAQVQRVLAAQPELATLDLEGGDLDAWSGALALTTVKGTWQGGEHAVLPALEVIDGRGPIPRGAPRLRVVSTDSGDVHFEDLPSLERILLRGGEHRSVTLRRLPKLTTLEWKSRWSEPAVRARTFNGCRRFELDSVHFEGDLRVGGPEAHVVARNVPNLTAISTDGTVELADLPHLQTLSFGRAERFPAATGVPALRSVTGSGAFTDIAEIASHTGLTHLQLTRVAPSNGAAETTPPPTLDLSPLARLTALEVLELRGVGGASLAPLATLRVLKDLTVDSPVDLVETLFALPDIRSVNAYVSVQARAVRALLEHPAFDRISVGWDVPAWIPRRPSSRSAGGWTPTATREALDLLLAGVARQPTPPARKDRAALAEARRILDANEPRKLLPLFASSGPDLARALCEGTHIDGDGYLVIGKTLTNATRVGVRGDAALLVADAAGLFDGIVALSLGGTELYDLGVLRRHAKTLRYLGGRHGDDLLRFLDAQTPLDGDPTEPLIAPLPPPVIDRLPLLLDAATEAEVMEGVALAITSERVREVLNGCRVRSATTAASGQLRTSPRAIFALLEALPAGDPAAREVTSDLARLDVSGSVAPWMRHAAVVRELAVARADLGPLLDLLPAAEIVTRLELRAAVGDLAPVRRLTGLTTLKLTGSAIDLRGLEGHPTIQELDVSGACTGLDAIAQLPALTRIRLGAPVQVDRICRPLGDRPVTCDRDGDRLVFTLGRTTIPAM